MNAEPMAQASAEAAEFPESAFDASFGPYPPDTLVVTRDRNGAPASRFRDLVWDRTAYATTGSVEQIHFTFWKAPTPTAVDLQLAREIQWIVYLQISCRAGGSPANATLITQARTLRRIALYAKEKSIGVHDVLSSPEHLTTMIADNGKEAGVLLDIVSSLRQYEAKQLGFVLVKKDALANLRALHYKWQEAALQTPPIPTRIYSEILASLIERVQEAQSVVEAVTALAQEYWTNPLIGRSREYQWRVRKEQGIVVAARNQPAFASLLKKYGLEEFWTKHNLREDGMSLSTLVTAFQLIAVEQIQAFSGMRIGEAKTLPYHCLKTVIRGGKKRYLILGRVTKLSNGKIKRAMWVTSESGRNAILLVQTIARFIYSIKNFELHESTDRLNNNYLFVSINFVKTKKGRNAPVTVDTESPLDIGRPSRPTITDADLHELEFIDPHRPWSEEPEFGLGRPWPIRTHQYRRSLAVYGQRSGLVALPSLKRQLHHITEAMSLFYGQGSAFAADLFAEFGLTKSEFAGQWEDARPVSQYLSYVSNVLMSNTEDLFGGHGTWVKNRLQGSETVFEHNRETTLQRFKNGEVAFKLTVWGGCVKPGPCDRHPLDIFNLGCLTTDCKYLAGSVKKLDMLIAGQQNFVAGLRATDPNSIECRQEEHDMKAMVAARERIRQVPRK